MSRWPRVVLDSAAAPRYAFCAVCAGVSPIRHGCCNAAAVLCHLPSLEPESPDELGAVARAVCEFLG